MEKLLVSDYDFYLPEEQIAQDPLLKRSDSRLLVLNRATGEIVHEHFYNIGNYLNAEDTLVINNTKVIPARLYGRRSTGAAIEVLLLKRLSDDTWEALTRPGKRTLPGTEIEFGEGLLKAVVEGVGDEGIRIIRFIYEGIFEEILDKLGEMPLPPYITHELKDRDRYQTVYAKYEGSAAAPTAGLHFTPELISSLKEKGIRFAEVTLHVGLGTFRPVKEENVLDHKMHEEYYEISPEAAEIINSTRERGGRIIAVGTTSVRTLETVASIVSSKNGDCNNSCNILKKSGQPVTALSGNTDIFIYPGYDFKAVDGIVTNFHLPKSTLLMLISAFANREQILETYGKAVENGYRFFSFGDAMLIL